MLTPPVSVEDHTRGGEHAVVTLVEYGDYECPHCGRAHSIVRETLRRLWDDVTFVFRHFPMAQAHPHALPAAEAAEAAGAQGRFWSMHDLLFERQHALEDEDLVAYAEELDLDIERFASEVANDAHLPKVQRDFRSGVRSGVNGTPTFFVDGQRFDGSWTEGGLALALTSAIRAKKSGIAAGLH
jgi:protein-disulfide isomerase